MTVHDDYYAALRASHTAKTVAEVARINHALSFIAGFDAYVQRMDKSDPAAQTLVLLGWNEECKETLEETLWAQKDLLLKQRQRPSDCGDLTEEAAQTANMDEHIKRSGVLKALCQVSAPTPSESYIVEKCIEKVNAVPAADVQEVKHGFWIHISNDDKWGLCSNCGLVVHMEGKYKFEGCPHCLAVMDLKRFYDTIPHERRE